MNTATFRALLAVLAAGFAAAFVIQVLPAALHETDVIRFVSDGFVNPYASGYSLDAIFCWCVLAVWVVYEARTQRIRYGWIALLLGLVPGVATGFAVYLLLRQRQGADNPARR